MLPESDVEEGCGPPRVHQFTHEVPKVEKGKLPLRRAGNEHPTINR